MGLSSLRHRAYGSRYTAAQPLFGIGPVSIYLLLHRYMAFITAPAFPSKYVSGFYRREPFDCIWYFLGLIMTTL